MKIEHVAFIMEDPVKAAKWYSENLGFKIVKSMNEHPFAHFLADDEDHMLLEIYHPNDKPLPKYKNMDPIVLHLALETEDVDQEQKRLVAAGATLEGEVKTLDNGDIVAMLKDPWGFTIQLIKRATPLV